MLKCGETNIDSKLVLKTEASAEPSSEDPARGSNGREDSAPSVRASGAIRIGMGRGAMAMGSAEPKEGEAARTGKGYQQFGHRRSPVRLRGVPIHGCHPKYICMQSEGGGRKSKGREKARERQRDTAVLHAGAVRRRRPG